VIEQRVSRVDQGRNDEILFCESQMAGRTSGRKAVAHPAQAGQPERGGRSIRTVRQVRVMFP
jgi:hypothetical protein